jgi:hypothetical protein
VIRGEKFVFILDDGCPLATYKQAGFSHTFNLFDLIDLTDDQYVIASKNIAVPIANHAAATLGVSRGNDDGWRKCSGVTFMFSI